MKLSISRQRLYILTAAISIFLIIPLIYGQTVATGTFGVELWIGNTAPTVHFDAGRSSTLGGIDPVTASNRLVWFVFNVTDADSEDNIDETSMRFNLTLGTPGSAQWRYNNTCTNVSKIPADNTVMFNCSVYLSYYDNASANWVLNVSVNDVNSASGQNDSETFTYNELTSVNLPVQYINFTSLTLGASNQPSGGAALVLNNTGNDDFDQINVTASDLVGVDTPSDTIPVANMAVNFTNAVDGDGRVLATSAVTVDGIDGAGNLTLTHGHLDAAGAYDDAVISATGNQSLYFYVDVPSGITAQKYNATWNMTFIDLP